MIMIGRVANLSRARQCGRRESIGMSTALHTRSAYSIVNTNTENRLNAQNSVA
jgi:hypothetical protein